MVKVFKFSDSIIVYTHIYTTFSNGNFQNCPFTTEVSSLFRPTNWDLQVLSNALVLLHTKMKNTRVLEQKVHFIWKRTRKEEAQRNTDKKPGPKPPFESKSVEIAISKFDIPLINIFLFGHSPFLNIWNYLSLNDKGRGHTLLNLPHSSV